MDYYEALFLVEEKVNDAIEAAAWESDLLVEMHAEIHPQCPAQEDIHEIQLLYGALGRIRRKMGEYIDKAIGKEGSRATFTGIDGDGRDDKL